MSTHEAAILSGKGERFTVQSIPTPQPGPHELLVGVKAIAVNPIDWKQRDFGLAVASYPAIVGSVGVRIAALANSFYVQGRPAYDGFQAKVVVPVSNAVVIPDSLSHIDAATLPVCVATSWAAWFSLGLPNTTTAQFQPSDAKALLVWSAASSAGGGAVQAARDLGFTVFATASPQHHAYVQSLGAAEVFDYHSADIVEQIVTAARRRGVTVQTAFHANGALRPVLDVVKTFGGGKVAETIPLTRATPQEDGVDIRFINAPADPDQRSTHFAFVFQEWLGPRLANGSFVPGPKTRVIPGGLGGLDAALDVLKQGVSGEKLVVEV